MPVCRPATPGLLVTLIATVLLLVVSLSGPYFKSIFFLKAAVTQSNQSGFITFGVLGYCSSVNGGAVNCTKAQIGYEFDPNALLGDNIKFLQIPTVVTKWITWALVLHIVALGLSAIAVVFGLLAHVREMAMTCFSSCLSGFAATVALVAFVFDLVLFFSAKARINSVQGGSAIIGSAIWLTLIAWVLLFFSGCFYSIGRCCISNRPSRTPGDDKRPGGWGQGGGPSESPYKDRYAEMMRLDAVKAEADRKARQAAPERGLPAFPAVDERKPLSSNYEATFEEEEPMSPYRDQHAIGRVGGPRNPQRRPTQHSTSHSANHSNAYDHTADNTGYVPGQPGSRTIDEYNSGHQYEASYPPNAPSRVSPGQSSTPAPYPNYQSSSYPEQATTGSPYGYNNQAPSNSPYHHAQYSTQYDANTMPQTAGGVAGAATHQYQQTSQYSHGRELSPYDHHQQQSSYYTAEGQVDQNYGQSYQHPGSPAPFAAYHHQSHDMLNPYNHDMINPHSPSPQPPGAFQPPDSSAAYPSSNVLPTRAPSNQSQPLTSAAPTNDTYYTAASQVGNASGHEAVYDSNNYLPVHATHSGDQRPDSNATSYFPYSTPGQPQPSAPTHSPPQYSQGNYQPNADPDSKR